MTLGRSVVEKANVASLRTQSSELESRAGSIEKNADALTSRFGDAPWTGKARDAAMARGESERREHRKVADDIRALATLLADSANDIERLATTLKRDATNLEAEQYEVGEQWKVTDGWNYALAFLVADADGDTEARARLERVQKQRADEAAHETQRLTSLARELTAIDQRTAGAISAHVQTIGRLTPTTSGLSKSRAERDMATLSGKKADGSTPSDEEVRDATERLHTAADLDTDERDQLKNTGQTQISQEQFEYLKGVADQLPDKVSNYDDVGKNLSPEQSNAVRGDVADTLRILGNPSVHTSNGESGGMQHLPANARSLLTETPTRPSTVLRPNPNGKSDYEVPAVELKRFDDWRALTNTLSSGDQDLRLGSDVDRGLLKQASEVAGKITPGSDAQLFSADSKIPDQDNQVRMTLDAMLNNASGDHAAVHDFVTGDPSMKATISGDGNYNATDHLCGLMEHKWEPGEHGTRNVFAWLGDTESLQTGGLEGKLSVATAFGLGNYLADDAQHLNSIGVTGGGSLTSLGSVNPELTQSLASDLAPHLGSFAGIPDQVLGYDGAPSFDSTSTLSQMLSVLDGNPGSAGIINHAGHEWQKFATDTAVRHPEWAEGLGNTSGKLHAAIQDGFSHQIDALKINDAYSSAVSANRAGALTDTVVSIGGLIPGVGPAFDVLAPGVKLDLLGNVIPPDQESISSYAQTLGSLQDDGESDSINRQWDWAKSYLADPNNDPQPFRELLVEGKLPENLTAMEELKLKDVIGRFSEWSSFNQEYLNGALLDRENNSEK